MNAATFTMAHGKRVSIARDRWVDDTRTGRLALAPDVHAAGRWGAAARSAPQISSSVAR